ncbi:hypothetical protein Bbelb_070170 [Branchiostoma belcheri]|nr:hypothetical protein Bbelb_070170 [Branchiostoma belcheri]
MASRRNTYTAKEVLEQLFDDSDDETDNLHELNGTESDSEGESDAGDTAPSTASTELPDDDDPDLSTAAPLVDSDSDDDTQANLNRSFELASKKSKLLTPKKLIRTLAVPDQEKTFSAYLEKPKRKNDPGKKIQRTNQLPHPGGRQNSANVIRGAVGVRGVAKRVTDPEILVYLRGVLCQNNCKTDTLFNDKTGHSVFSATMGKKRFKFLMANIRFDDEETRGERRQTASPTLCWPSNFNTPKNNDRHAMGRQTWSDNLADPAIYCALFGTLIIPIISTSNTMYLRFTSNFMGSSHGFHFFYTSRTAGQCWDPGVPANGNRDINSNFTSGQTVRYTCMDGYQLWGTANITCQPNGTWIGSTPTCEGNHETMVGTVLRTPSLTLKSHYAGPRALSPHADDTLYVFDHVFYSMAQVIKPPTYVVLMEKSMDSFAKFCGTSRNLPQVLPQSPARRSTIYRRTSRGTREYRPPCIKIGEKPLKAVHQFTYLGSTITPDAKIDKESDYVTNVEVLERAGILSIEAMLQ